MKRFVILAISIIVLVFCLSSCGEKALDPNYLPHNQNVKIVKDKEEMIKLDDIGGSLPQQIDGEDEIVYKKDSVSVGGVKFDCVKYETLLNTDEYPTIYYRIESGAKKSDYEKLTKILNLTYGEYQANENDKKFETEEMTVKTWKFILDDGTPMKALTTFKNGKSMDLLIGAD